MPRKVFVANEILTAADVNTQLMDQAVMVFDDDAARTAAIPSPSEGMVTYLRDTDSLDKRTASAWVPVDTGRILQVVSATKVDSFFTTTTGSFQDIPGLSVSITPSSATSKILCTYSVIAGNGTAGQLVTLNLVRNATNISQSTGGTARNQTTFAFNSSAQETPTQTSTFLDSPNTTSAVTYKVQLRVPSGSGAVNRRGDAVDDGGTSSITVMEVKG
jgi:hypothetical protein